VFVFVFVLLATIVAACGEAAGSVAGQNYPMCTLFGEAFIELSFVCLANQAQGFSG